MPKLIEQEITITEADLTLALARPWATTTCLVAQATRRAFGSTVHACSYGVVQLDNDQCVYYQLEVTSLQRLFDRVHSAALGTDHEAEMAELRGLLPATFTIMHTSPTPTPTPTNEKP